MNAFLLLPLLLVSQPQTAPPQRTSTKRPAAQTKTVVGVLTALDATKNTLTLQPDNGTVAIAVSIAPDAAFTKKGEPAKLTDFQLQDHVSARLSLRPDKPAVGVLKSLKDADSAAETKKTATGIYTGTVVTSSLTNLDAKDKDGKTTRFRVSEKTVFTKADKPARPADFTPDSPVAVLARSSSSGNLLATIIADSAAAAEQAKNDTLSTWTGTVMEKKDSLLTLKRDDGATRLLQIAPTATEPFEKLTVGKRAHLHLVRGEPDKDGHRTTDKFTSAR
jgi:hypothetical protein